MKKIVCIAICLYTIVSCSSGKNSNFIISDFPKELEISSEKIQISSILLNINRLIVVDSFLVISQNRRKDTLFSIFKLPDFKHFHSFGTKGNGPNEFNMSFASTFNKVYTGSSSFAIGNRMNNVQYYNIGNLKSNISVPYKKVRLPVKLNGFRAMSYIGDSLIFGAPYGGDNIDLFKFSTKNKNLEKYVEYPGDFPLIDAEQKRSVYGCYMAVKPDNSKFVRTYANIGKIEIFDIGKNELSPVVLEYKDFPSVSENLKIDRFSRKVKGGKEQKVFSWGVRASENYIFVSVYNDFFHKISGSKGPSESFIPEIHVFDWFGKPIVKYKLDSHFVFYDVDKSGKFMYTSSLSEDGVVRRYDLNKNLF